MNFVPGSTNSTQGPSSALSNAPFDSSVGDGSKEEVYCCLRGHLGNLRLSEDETGLVLMCAYGLMRAKDLELLPTTWRLQLLAAIRFAVLHSVRDREKARDAATQLQVVVELWRPTWRADYDAFSQRKPVHQLMASALEEAKILQTNALYKDEKWKELSPPPAICTEDDASGEIASI